MSFKQIVILLVFRYTKPSKIEKMYSSLRTSAPDIHSDFSRIARSLLVRTIYHFLRNLFKFLI